MAELITSDNLSFSAWENMWLDYAGKRSRQLSPEINRTTYSRLIDPHFNLFGVAVKNESPVGFAQYYFHPSSWSVSEVCFLQDLYVCPSSRGLGLGKALIAAVAENARAKGSSELYWQTRVSNEAAQSLYDKFAERVDFIPYRMALT